MEGPSLAINVFLSCSQPDSLLLRELVNHLAVLQREGHIRVRSSQDVQAGEEPDGAIRSMLDASRVILLLVSADFLASDAHMAAEVPHALRRHRAGEATVIPVILRPCDWQSAAFAGLQALPEDMTPVTAAPNRDQAWDAVARAVRRVVERLQLAPEDDLEAHHGDRGVNPFEYGRPVPPERFIGRRAQIADIRGRIGGISAQSISVVGLQRSGKSSLFAYIATMPHVFCQPAQNPLVILLDLQAKQYHTPEGLLEGLRRGVESRTGISPWRSDQNNDNWAVEEGLAALRDRGTRLLVLLDEFERIGARLERFQDWGEDFRHKASDGFFALVIGTKRPLVEVYTRCGLTSPFGNIFSTTTLGAFLPNEWRELVRVGFKACGVVVTNADLEVIDALSGGLPFYVQMAAALLWRHRDHKQTSAAFGIQFSEQFLELWRHLTLPEQRALRYASGTAGVERPEQGTVDVLTRHGLLRPDGRVFSSAFVSFARIQR
jgi:hypothetical protein